MSKSFDPNQLYIELSIVDALGHVHGTIRKGISDDVAYMGERLVEDMRMSAEVGISLMPMSEVMRVMHVKQFRRSLLIHAATNMGHSMADHLEDREGWHGIERSQRVRERYK